MVELIRVLVVDDHPVVLGGFVTALSAAEGIDLVGQATNVAEAIAIIASQRVDVALVDLRLPDGSGLEILVAADKVPNPPAFLIISSFETPQYVDAAIRMGAGGFLLKTAPLEVVVDAIRRIASGGTAFTVNQLRGARQHPWEPLTTREAAVVGGVMAGRSNDELSADLGISKKTVEAYLTRLYERHDVSTRVELAVKASKEGWLELPPNGRPTRT
jgi:DNA-binding NarL/FixJ family response regulator